MRNMGLKYIFPYMSGLIGSLCQENDTFNSQTIFLNVIAQCKNQEQKLYIWFFALANPTL